MSVRIKSAFLIVLAFILTASLFSCAGKKPPEGLLRVGMSKVNITPTQDVYLWGYENKTPNVLCKYPDDILDDIFARILVVEADGKRVVYVHVDLWLLEEGRSCSANFRLDIAQKYGVAEDDVILTSAHNHQAQEKLSHEEEEKIIEAVGVAIERMEPCYVGVTVAPNPYGVSRSPSYGIDTRAPYDNLMTVLRFDNAKTGDPVGMVFSYPAHNTTLSNGAAKNRNLLTSEFTGFATKYIEEQMNGKTPDFVAIHLNGATGNAGPLFEGKYNLPYEDMKRAGAELGQFVFEYYGKIKADQTYKTVASLFETVKLETNQVDISHKSYFGSSRYKDLKVYASAFGDVAVIGVGAETFTITGAHLRAESPYRYTMNTGCVNGWVGYIPTRETFESGRTEEECQPWKTPFTADTEQIMYKELLDILCGLAGVKIKSRVRPQAATPDMVDGKGVYKFDFGSAVKPDKVVLDFGQKSRTDCPADFVLCLYDGDGNTVLQRTFTNNSVNYLGVFTDGITFKSAEVRVSRSYLDPRPLDGLPVSLYALSFEPLS